MRFTASTDIPDYARHVLDAVQALENRTAAELEKLADRKDLRDEVIEARRKAIAEDYRTEFSKIRSDYSGKIDRRLDEVRKLADFIQEPQPNPSTAGILTVLTAQGDQTPVTKQMIEAAAKQIGDDDEFARLALFRIAEAHGYGASIAQMKPPKARLTKQHLEECADDLTFSFRRFFDSHADYKDFAEFDRPSEQFINNAARAGSAADLRDIAGGAGFGFGGSGELMTQFSNLAASAEL